MKKWIFILIVCGFLVNKYVLPKLDSAVSQNYNESAEHLLEDSDNKKNESLFDGVITKVEKFVTDLFKEDKKEEKFIYK